MELVFDLQLPFKLPIEDGFKMASAYTYPDEQFFIEFKTISIIHNLPNETEDTIPNLPQKETVLTITYWPDEDSSNKDKDILLRQTVLNSINHVNKFIDALRHKHDLSYIYNLTIADLPHILIITLNGQNYMYITQPDELIRDDIPLDKEAFKKVLGTMATFDANPEIFLVERFLDSAKSHIYKEQFIDAIIDLQTSFEIFIRNTHRLILKKENFTEQEIERASQYYFRNVIEQHLSKYLKEDLSFDLPGPINDWYNNLYTARNAIVHRGFTQINGDAAYRAYESYVKARNYISDKLVDESYLNSDGKVDLNLFKVGQKGEIDKEKFIGRLKELGLIDLDAEYKVEETD